MDVKKILGLIFTLIGAAGLVYGVIAIFNGNIMESNSWIFAILGGVFFAAGLGLLKSIKTIETK